MTFRFSTLIKVRYADLDAQGHVNNARYFTFMEQARLEYCLAAGLWANSQDFMGVGQIVAEAACTFKRPIRLGETVEVAVRITRLGHKSLEMEYRLTVNGDLAATGRSVQVAYDYDARRSIPIPAVWREMIVAYEPGLTN